jgi:N-methylhydantoinase A
MTGRLIGVDTGGTFTDLVALGPEGLVHHKLASTPAAPHKAVLDGIQKIVSGGKIEPADRMAHGTTVATNAILTGNVASAVLVTTSGFEDVLEIGRQERPSLYDFEVERRPPLIERGRRLGVKERIGPEGQVEEALGPDGPEIKELLQRIAALDPPAESIAVSLLHSYANSEHEAIVAAALEKLLPGIGITLSCELIPVFREYERTSTVVINAAVQPVMGGYLDSLRSGLSGAKLSITTSSGGSLTARQAAREPVHTLLSGPAAGVAGAVAVARRAGFTNILTFDMGGTSTDVALCEGDIRQTSEGGMEGYPLLVAQVDLHTVGAGGGSLARVDRGGAVVVGPESAGAEPGPLAYGNRLPGHDGEGVTVTDANLVLGRLPEGGLLGGSMALEKDASLEGLGRLAAAASEIEGARKLTGEQAAEGVIRVAITAMAGALRRISVERGKDPREYVLVAFGGAGAMHAAALAGEMGIGQVLVPYEPGLLSAVGTLVAGLRIDRARTILGTDPEHDSALVESAWRDIEREVKAGLEEAGVASGQCLLARRADMRYFGQSFELTVEASGWSAGDGESWERLCGGFAAAHRERYGYDRPGTKVELVSLRVEGHGPGAAALDDLLPSLDAETAAEKEYPVRDMVWEGEVFEAVQVPRKSLRVGQHLRGPALIHEFSATTIVPPDAGVEVGAFGDLLIDV